MSQDNISDKELDLTETELDRIFFGSNEPVIDGPIVKDDSSKEPEKSIPIDHIEKNINRKTINLKHTLPSKPKKLKRKNKLEEPEPKKESKPKEEQSKKRPIGRPKKWTPELIKQKKDENKRAAQLRRSKKKEERRLSELANNIPITDYERKQRIEDAIKSKEDIEKHISNKRTILKKAIGRKSVQILDRETKCKEHIYKICFTDEVNSEYITACIHCSKSKVFSPNSWKMYMNKHRTEL